MHLIKHKDKARVTPIEGEGRVRGYQVETGDGRQAAIVRPDPIKQKMSVSGKDNDR